MDNLDSSSGNSIASSLPPIPSSVANKEKMVSERNFFLCENRDLLNFRNHISNQMVLNGCQQQPVMESYKNFIRSDSMWLLKFDF